MHVQEHFKESLGMFRCSLNRVQVCSEAVWRGVQFSTWC
jgi:hypothetical protein